MAKIEIPDDVLKPEDVKDLQDAVNKAVEEKRRTGVMTMSRFMNIIKEACYWIWDKIKGFFSSFWEGICDLFS